MKLSELQAALTKVQQIAGDIEVRLRDVEHDIETGVKDLVVHIDPAGGQAGGKVVLRHTQELSVPPAPAAQIAPPDAE